MIPQSPGSIVVTIGSFSISWYGLCIAVAAAFGFFVIYRKTKNDKKFSDTVIDMAFWSLLCGFIGARLYHVWNEWWWYQNHLSDMWRVWDGGLAIHGGILAGATVLFFMSRKGHISFFRVTDIFALALILGQALGRLGNYFNEELFGKPLDAWWGLHVSFASRPPQFQNFQSFHPLFLYELILNLLLFSFLQFFWNRLHEKEGIVTGMYCIGYGVIRFSLDFFRFDQFGYGFLTFAQWMSIAMMTAGAALLAVIWHRRRSKEISA